MSMSCKLLLAFTLGFSLSAGSLSDGQQPNPREEKLRADRARVEAEGFWIYNDLPRAFAIAEETGKPIIVVLRCVPCEECVKLDDELIDQDPTLKELLSQFVCARQVSANGINLSIFQFDTDQSWAVFLLNADGTIYGRFGTRSHRTDWVGDVSVAGLAEAMRGALELHAAYPANRDQLLGKRGAPLEAESPEEFSSLAGKYTDELATTGNIGPSCIHCHQIGEARRAEYRRQGDAIPEQLFYPYPHPKSIGLRLDPDRQATIIEVTDGTAAELAGFEAGDQIVRLDSQPLLSIADVQWVLHHADPAGDEIEAEVERGGKIVPLTLKLDDGWRRADNISWRASSWEFRRMATGGLLLEPLPPKDREELGIEEGKMALRVKHVGQYGEHAAAKRAGFQVGDVIVAYDGQSDLMQEGDVFYRGVNEHKVGDKISVSLLREGRQMTLGLPIQK